CRPYSSSPPVRPSFTLHPYSSSPQVRRSFTRQSNWSFARIPFVSCAGIADSTAFGLTDSALVFGFHGFASERKFSIHKVPLETYMSKLCVYFLIAPSCVLIQPAIMWKTHTPTVLVDAGIVLSKRALPDKYRQLNLSSRSHVHAFSPMISVASFSPH